MSSYPRKTETRNYRRSFRVRPDGVWKPGRGGAQQPTALTSLSGERWGRTTPYGDSPSCTRCGSSRSAVDLQAPGPPTGKSSIPWAKAVAAGNDAHESKRDAVRWREKVTRALERCPAPQNEQIVDALWRTRACAAARRSRGRGAARAQAGRRLSRRRATTRRPVRRRAPARGGPRHRAREEPRSDRRARNGGARGPTHAKRACAKARPGQGRRRRSAPTASGRPRRGAREEPTPGADASRRAGDTRETRRTAARDPRPGREAATRAPRAARAASAPRPGAASAPHRRPQTSGGAANHRAARRPPCAQRGPRRASVAPGTHDLRRPPPHRARGGPQRGDGWAAGPTRLQPYASARRRDRAAVPALSDT